MFKYDLSKSVDEIRIGYKYDETCQGTVPQAITCFLERSSFEDAIRNAISIGGDSDTIGAIAGGMAEARWGIPNLILEEVKCRITQEMNDVLTSFYDRLLA